MMFSILKDKTIVKTYDVKSLKNKEENKKKVCEELGLEYNSDKPMFAMVSRLVGQKRH